MRENIIINDDAKRLLLVAYQFTSPHMIMD